MKLGEALLERSLLERRLDLLEARLGHEVVAGRPTTHLVDELQRITNLLRDITIAIGWTEQQVLLSDLPLAAYRVRILHLNRLADTIDSVNFEKADKLREAANKDYRIVEAATWLVDLQVPVISAPAKESSSKEVED